MPDLEDHEERIARTERNLDRLTSVDDRMADKADRFVTTDKLFAKTNKRFAEAGERIDSLVSAIGEFIRTEANNRGPGLPVI